MVICTLAFSRRANDQLCFLALTLTASSSRVWPPIPCHVWNILCSRVPSRCSHCHRPSKSWSVMDAPVSIMDYSGHIFKLCDASIDVQAKHLTRWKKTCDLILNRRANSWSWVYFFFKSDLFSNHISSHESITKYHKCIIQQLQSHNW